MREVTALVGAAALAASVWAIPSSAQQMNESDIEFLAEMLAMGELCPDVGVGTRYDALTDYVASRLTGQTQADLDAVLALRDEKIGSLHVESDRVRNINGGRRRENAVNDYYADLISRCYRLADSETAAPYFNRGYSPTANY